MARAKAAQPQTSAARLKRMAREPSTYAGLLTVLAAVVTGGASVLTDPSLLAQLGSGLALIFTREAT